MISLVIIVIGAGAGLSALLYFAQDRLIFYPQAAPGMPPHAANLAISEVRIATPDGVSLRGWLAKPAVTDSRPLPLAIYFGGNAEEVSYMAALAGRLPGWALLAVNYRGYGGNAGSPSERALCSDALAVHDWASRNPEFNPARIVAMGRSLGSGVAVYLAAERPLAGVILVTPYDSLRAVAQRHYPFAPVGLLLKHNFDSILRAPRIQAPVLMLAARRDSVVPMDMRGRCSPNGPGPEPGASLRTLDTTTSIPIRNTGRRLLPSCCKEPDLSPAGTRGPAASRAGANRAKKGHN